MIKLPDKWEEMIQFRGWVKPVNEFAEIGIFLFMIRNTDGYWAYQRLIKIPEAAFADMPAVKKNDILKQGYDKLLYDLPTIAVEQKYVMRYENGEEKAVVITDNSHWEMLKIADSKLFNAKKLISEVI